jgi:outer membrane receptor protein involved in Fe transport
MGANYTYLDATYRSTEIVGAAGNSSNDQTLAGLPGVGGTVQISPGNRMPLVPRQMLKVFANYDIDAAWSLGLDMVAFAGSIARGNENNQHQSDGLYYLGAGNSAGYAVVNLTADYRPTPKLKFFALVSNLLDRRYHTAAQLGATGFDANGGVRTQPFAANAAGDRPLQYSTFYAPGAPRALVVGMRYAFGD